VAVIEAVAPEAAEQPSYDERGLSLALSSQRILAALGVWPALAAGANPIEHIHVSDRGHFGFVRLHAADLDLPALGHVVVARQLGAALLARLREADNIDLLCPASVGDARQGDHRVGLVLQGEAAPATLDCRLLVVADGTRSGLRERLGIGVSEEDYGQSAVVANVTPQRGHANWAFERFTADGPLALLPLAGGHCVSVCGVPGAAAGDYLGMSEADYLAQLQDRFGRRLGRLTRLGRRRAYPLVKLEPESARRGRALLLGNAAHTLHPNGAQGFNLGLRDAAGLAEVLSAGEADDPGAEHLLAAYEALRRGDQQRVIRFTDRLAGLFYNDDPALILARDTGMLLTDLLPGLKRAFIRRATGLAGRQPAMAISGSRHEY
jgi:2-octaprenyl-6-methoxyphenol hydroxylase